MTNLHSYFSHSPKHHLKFQKLVAITETNGNKILKNMKTQWMSMLDLLKRIIIEYKPLFTIMQADQNPYKWQKVNETPHVQIDFFDYQFFKT
jgi:hypothetical protein